MKIPTEVPFGLDGTEARLCHCDYGGGRVDGALGKSRVLLVLSSSSSSSSSSSLLLLPDMILSIEQCWL